MQELHQSSQMERRSQGIRAGSQEGEDALRLPGTLTEHLHPRESMPHPMAELPIGLQHTHSLTQKQLGVGSGEGSEWRGLCGPGSSSAVALTYALQGRGCRTRRMNPTAQGQEHKVSGTQAKIQCSTQDRTSHEGPGQQGRSCHWWH